MGFLYATKILPFLSKTLLFLLILCYYLIKIGDEGMANTKKTNEKTKKKNITKTQKKTIEAKIEPITNNEMSNDMVEKEDKIWIIIAVLLVILICGAYIANKLTAVDVIEKTIIETKKKIMENNDGTVEVNLTLESNIGIKTIKLEDGTVLNYNGKKEVVIKFTADENRKYKFVIKDINGNEITKDINISGVTEKVPVKEEILEVKTESKNNNYKYPIVPMGKPVVKDYAIIEGVSNGDITNENIELTIKGTYNKIIILKNGEIDKTLNTTFTEEGNYIVKAMKDNKELSKIEFEIDKTCPEFYNGMDLINTELNTVKIFNIKAEDKNEVSYLVKENEQTKIFEDMIIDEIGNYEITATDIAGNEKTINVNMLNLFTMSLNQMIFSESITIKYNELLTNTNTYTTTLEVYNKTTDTFDIIIYEVGNEITESGLYKLTVNIDGTDVIATFTIDKKAPVIDVTVDDDKINVTATDEESGVKDVLYGFANDKIIEPDEYKKLLDSIEEPDKEGEYYLWIKATDNAENQTTKVVDDVIKVEDNKIEESETIIKE